MDRSRKKMEALSADVSRIQEVMAELTIKIQDGTSWLEGLKAEARVQPSPVTVPTDPQEEIRLLRARIAQMERFNGGRRAGGEESQDLCHDISGCGADLPKWTSIEGQAATKTSCVGCRTGRPTCKKQHWQGWSGGGKAVPRHGHRSYELVNSFSDAFDGVQRSPMRDVKIQDLVPRLFTTSVASTVAESVKRPTQAQL